MNTYLKHGLLGAAPLTLAVAVGTMSPAQAQPATVTVDAAEYAQLKADVADLKEQLAAMKSGGGMTDMGGSGEEKKNWYVGVSLGGQHRADAKDKLGAATVFKNPGYILNGALGYKLGGGFRVEGEAGLINNVNKREIVTGAFNEAARGNISLQTFMANVYYDVPIKNSKFKPFVGAGIGVFQSQVNGLTSATLLSGVPGFFGPTIVDTKSKYTAAHQFKVGVGYDLNPKTTLFADYRMFRGAPFRLTSATLGTLDVNGPKVDAIEVGVHANF